MSQDRCKAVDFGVFLDLWNVTQNQQTPIIHFRMANWLQKSVTHGHRRLLLQAFRASGKSTLGGLFSAWMLYKDPDLRILVLAAESSLSQKMARTIRKVIERHPLTTHLKPDQPDQWAADSFTIQRSRVSRDPSVLARGLYANTTGTRADVIICDDVEVPNTCDTAEKREQLRDRLLENDFILTPDGLMLYIGTPHHYHSIYAKDARPEFGEQQVFLKNYQRLSIAILSKDGQSQWPERYTLDDIDDLMRRSGPSRFTSQMMLVPTNFEDNRLNPHLLNRYDDDLVSREIQQALVLSIGGKKIVSASSWWDPSFAGNKNDRSVLAIVFTDEDGNQYLHKVAYLKGTPDSQDMDEASFQCKQICALAQQYFLPSVAVEVNGIGKFLPAILRKELALAKVPCAVIEKHSSQSKDLRILEAFDAVMAARSLFVHRDVYETPFIKELEDWRPGLKTARDDGLDAAAGALLLEPLRIRRYYGAARRFWRSSRQHILKSNFEV
jgi:hypothetical protein